MARTREEQRRMPERDEETAQALRLFVVLQRAAESVDAHSRADIARHGLTPAEFAVLEVLYHKGPLLLKDVQQKILVSSGGITYLVDRLAARGFVERRACETDRRASYAALTGEGEALIAEIFPAHAQTIERSVQGLDAGEREIVIALLRKLGHTAEALPLPER
jgi:MarR family transcriptional regulator, 2-MHQ and catechol-resistance regulon repressor